MLLPAGGTLAADIRSPIGSTMYLDFFGLDSPPFKITPRLDLFYPGGKRGTVLDALLYAVSSNEGIVKVVGEVGSGKTMLCRMLEDRLSQSVETIYIANPSLNRDEILCAVAEDMGIDIVQRTTFIIRALQQRLIEKHAEGKQVVVFIDEAQAMPIESLEEVRLLSNLETGTHKLLQILLFGQPELDAHLAQPKIRQLRERITHSFELSPLSPDEIRDYLMFRLRAVGYQGSDIFSREAVDLIVRASQGLIRRVNILADKAMLAAFAENSHEIRTAHAQAAIRDSGLKVGWPWKKIAVATTAAAALVAAGSAAVNRLPTPAKSPPSAVAPAPPRPAVIEPAAPHATPTTLLEQRQEATEKWLAGEDGRHYTIQVGATAGGDQEKLAREIGDLAKNVGAENVYLYATQAQNRQVYGITYGNFADYGEAKRAATRLPSQLQAKHPVLRTVGGIRAELTAQQAASGNNR